MGMLVVALVSIMAQCETNHAQPMIYILDFGAADAPGADTLAQLADRMLGAVKIGRRQQLPAILTELSDEVSRRANTVTADQPSRYLLIYGLQRARD